MYRERVPSWLKRFDFLLFDIFALEISFVISYMIRCGFISEDYVAYGFTDQFTNRFDKKIYLNKLTRENLSDIAKNSISSPLVLLQEDYGQECLSIS